MDGSRIVIPESYIHFIWLILIFMIEFLKKRKPYNAPKVQSWLALTGAYESFGRVTTEVGKEQFIISYTLGIYLFLVKMLDWSQMRILGSITKGARPRNP